MGVSAPGSPRWHLAYLVLAALNVCTLGMGVFLNHKMSVAHASSVASSRSWANRMDLYGQLRDRAQAVNAPGNDVFDSKKPEEEGERLRKAHAEFLQVLIRTRGDVEGYVGGLKEEGGGRELLTQLAAVERAEDEMVAEAGKIFAFFRENQPEKAGERMATMDRRYGDVSQALSGLSGQSHRLQLAEIEAQSKAASEFRWLEMLVGAAVFPTVIAVALYGTRMSRALQRSSELQAEQATRLAEAEARVRRIIDTTAEGIISLGGRGDVLAMNPAARALLGHEAGDLARLHARDLFLVPAGGEPPWGVVGPLQEVVCCRKEGGQFPAELRVQPAEQGEFVLFVRDKTEEKRRIEAEERARLLAEQASRTKSEFLANMSHEIRTPMTAILGYADLLLDSHNSPSDRLNHVLTMRRNGEHLLGIINDILDISKIEAGMLRTERLRCSINQILVDVLSLMRPRAEEKLLGLAVRFDTPVPREIETDGMRLRQVLINLVGNAVKFTSEGKVELFLRYEKGDKGRLFIDVSDTGIGLTEEQIHRLFLPFSQADTSTTRQFGGTGLGLAISKRLAVALGGDLTVQSLPRRGSTFTVSISVEQASGETIERVDESVVAAPVTASVDTLEGVRILLAEDGVDNQALFRAHLGRAGAVLTCVDNGQDACDEALRAEARGEPFDLILMDMQMPVRDGYAATASLRGKGYGRSIVALTAHAMAGDREKCLAAGCDDVLTKPIARDLLISSVQAIAGRRPRPAKGPPLRSIYEGDAEMHPLIADFVARLGEYTVALRKALEADQTGAMLSTAHQLKGAAGGYGYPAITEAARELEQALREDKERAVVVRRFEVLASLIERAVPPRHQLA